MAKEGRPTKPARERQSHQIAVRLMPGEHKALEDAASKTRLSVSDYIRLKLGFLEVMRWADELFWFLKKLGQLWRRLANTQHATGREITLAATRAPRFRGLCIDPRWCESVFRSVVQFAWGWVFVRVGFRQPNTTRKKTPRKT